MVFPAFGAASFAFVTLLVGIEGEVAEELGGREFDHPRYLVLFGVDDGLGSEGPAEQATETRHQITIATTLGGLFIAAGAIAWERRPEVRTGPLLLAASVLWFVGSYAPTSLIVLSQYLEPDYALRLLGAGMGGVGYLLKDRVADPSELVDAVKRVAGGGSAVDPAVVGELVRARRREDRLHRLTERERIVLELLAEGRSNRSIADRLTLSIKTVEGAIATILSKLGLEPDPDDNRRVLAVLAYLDPGQTART